MADLHSTVSSHFVAVMQPCAGMNMHVNAAITSRVLGPQEGFSEALRHGKMVLQSMPFANMVSSSTSSARGRNSKILQPSACNYEYWLSASLSQA